jgi:hypothetical protein
MEARKIEYNGHNYLINHLYTDTYYGRKDVYHVLTNNQKWCGSLIPELCRFPDVESKGEHDLNSKRNPSMLTALKPYYTVDFKQDDMYEKHFDMKAALDGFEVDLDSYYVFTYKEPYDD